MNKINICVDCICLPMCRNKDLQKLVDDCQLFFDEIGKAYEVLPLDTEKSVYLNGLKRFLVLGVRRDERDNVISNYKTWYEVP